MDPLSSYFHTYVLKYESSIRNNKDIKRVTIGVAEYKVSQYTDDTSLIFNESTEYQEKVLKVLDLFDNFTGFRIFFF